MLPVLEDESRRLRKPVWKCVACQFIISFGRRINASMISNDFKIFGDMLKQSESVSSGHSLKTGFQYI